MRHSSYGPRKKRGVAAPLPIPTKKLTRLLMDWQLRARNAAGLALNGPRNIITTTLENGGCDGDARAGSI